MIQSIYYFNLYLLKKRIFMKNSLLFSLLLLSVNNTVARDSLLSDVYKPEHAVDGTLGTCHPLYYLVKAVYLRQNPYEPDGTQTESLKKEVKRKTANSFAITEIENAILGDRFDEYIDEHYTVIYLYENGKEVEWCAGLKLFIVNETTCKNEKDILYIVQLDEDHSGKAYNAILAYKVAKREYQFAGEPQTGKFFNSLSGKWETT